VKQTMTGFVYRVQYYSDAKPTLCWHSHDKMGERDPHWVLVGPHDFEVECPDDFDPRPQQIAAIDGAITQARAEFTKRLNELQEQKNKLLCLEMAP
jgi:hypothetical protein